MNLVVVEKRLMDLALVHADHSTCMQIMTSLDLVHAVDVAGLDIVLELLNLLGQLLYGDLIVNNSAHDLQLLDTITDGDEFGGAPGETVHLDALDRVQHFLVAGLIVPRLNIEEYRGFGDKGRFLGLLFRVGLQSLSRDSRLLRVIFFFRIGAKQVHVIIVVILPLAASYSLRYRQNK